MKPIDPCDRPARIRRLGPNVVTGLFLAGTLATAVVNAGADAAVPARTPSARLESLPLERPDDPPGVPAEVSVAQGPARPATVFTFGRFTHRQVNVNRDYNNIVGDAANEPSIAVDPTNHDRMVIGWRQFDTVVSNFRQAGYGYTTDGGFTWTTGKLEPGVFRSDPVLGVDASGRFLYNSLTSTTSIYSWIFASTNGGASWSSPVFAYGGDKQWMTVDRTGGAGNGFLYQSWSVVGNDYYPATFNRSTDGGATFQVPSQMAGEPIWGTLDLDANDSLYYGGMDPNVGNVIVARSADAWNTIGPPSFSAVVVMPDCYINTGGPNPAGLDGQVWISVDKSSGPRRGWVYVLASVQTPTDPMDVMFTRSSDGGKTWSTPKRVNDDPAASHAWQWFGTMAVSPNGRIDAVWNDSRVSGDSTKTALFYSYSDDGGVTWSTNEQASAVWTSTVGFPNQSKIGDYYQLISGVDGADLAWAATFNNEEDIYYTRIPHQTTSVAAGEARPSWLHPGTPNPFSSSTDIRFDVPAAGARVRLEVFDAAGHRVTTLADGFMGGGSQVVRWSGRDADGRQANSGLYFCRYQADGAAETAKLMLIR